MFSFKEAGRKSMGAGQGSERSSCFANISQEIRFDKNMRQNIETGIYLTLILPFNQNKHLPLPGT